MTKLDGVQSLDQVLRIASVGVWEWLPLTDKIHWSEEILRIWGFDPASHDIGVLPDHFAALSAHIHPEDRAAWTENVRACLEQGHEHAMELRIVRPNGEIRWVQVRGSAERDAAGQVIRLLGVVTDVTDRVRVEQQTERRRIENELRTSEGRLQEAERIARIGSWCLDVQSDRLLWSDGVFRLFGVEPGAFDASYQAFLDHVHPDDRDLVDQTYQASLASQTVYEATHRIRPANGEVRWLHERAETRFGPDGRPVRSMGTVQDVTESRGHEEQISLVARRTEALLELPRATETLDETAFMQRGQELAENLTGSRIAFIHFINDDNETIELISWSHLTLSGSCTAAHDRHYPISSAGIWADAFRKRTPVIFNDYPAYEQKGGCPTDTPNCSD